MCHGRNLRGAFRPPQDNGDIVNRITVAICLLIFAAPAGAQIYGQHPAREPSLWASGGIGLFAADGVNDGSTGSTWDFGSGTNIQYRGSLEKSFRNQTAIGITAGYVSIPFTYRGSSSSLLAAQDGATCAACNAHLQLYSAALSLHVGGTQGFHQVLDASAGVNHYRNLKRDADGALLAPAKGNTDPAFTFGYGFGYNFNRFQEAFIVQDYGVALHERTGLQNSQSNTLTMRITRLGYRMGFGTGSPVRRR
jgi:hypothetical protein